MSAAIRQGPDWSSHRAAAAVENVRDLLAAGESLELALARAGITQDAYEQHLHRARRRATA